MPVSEKSKISFNHLILTAINGIEIVRRPVRRHLRRAVMPGSVIRAASRLVPFKEAIALKPREKQIAEAQSSLR